MIDIDIEKQSPEWANETELHALSRRALEAACQKLAIKDQKSELSLIFMNDAQIRAINAQWRQQDKATNVLSFPTYPSSRPEVINSLLGDILFAYETIRREAEQEGKSFDDHLTHLFIHGFLHLLGYDHQTEEEAEIMEQYEREILHLLSIEDPYKIKES